MNIYSSSSHIEGKKCCEVLKASDEGLMMVNKDLNTCHTSEHQDDNPRKLSKLVHSYLLCIPLLLF